MKILFFHRWVGVHGGGTETHLKMLAFKLKELGHDVEILTREGNELKENKDIKVWRIPKTLFESPYSYEDFRVYIYTFIYMIKAALFLLYLKYIKKKNYDVVSVHFTVEALIMRILKPLLKWPYVFILEGYTDHEAKEAKHADAVVGISMDEIKRVKEKYGYEPIFIPIGIEKKKFQSKAKSIKNEYCKKNEKFVLTLCRIEPRKDIPTLIEAIDIIVNKKKYTDAKFIIVGEGISSNKIKEMIKDKNLTKYAIMVGRIDDKDVPSYYKSADLFVLPTLYEGFGIVFIEAMCFGVPIISTNISAVPEVVGNAGILIEPKNPELLANTILKVLKNERLLKELSNNAKKRIKLYDWDNLIKKYEAVYKSVVK